MRDAGSRRGSGCSSAPVRAFGSSGGRRAAGGGVAGDGAAGLALGVDGGRQRAAPRWPRRAPRGAPPPTTRASVKICSAPTITWIRNSAARCRPAAAAWAGRRARPSGRAVARARRPTPSRARSRRPRAPRSGAGTAAPGARDRGIGGEGRGPAGRRRAASRGRPARPAAAHLRPEQEQRVDAQRR